MKDGVRWGENVGDADKGGDAAGTHERTLDVS